MHLTSAQVKNLMRRGLRLIVDPDPDPDDRQRVYAYFGHECAYCGAAILKGGGDLDHLVSSAKGGTNHLSNRVLSCKPCNAKEKRELEWYTFLKRKTPDGAALIRRTERIEAWVRSFDGARKLDSELLCLIDEEASKATAAYDVACQKIKEANRTTRVRG